MNGFNVAGLSARSVLSKELSETEQEVVGLFRSFDDDTLLGSWTAVPVAKAKKGFTQPLADVYRARATAKLNEAMRNAQREIAEASTRRADALRRATFLSAIATLIIQILIWNNILGMTGMAIANLGEWMAVTWMTIIFQGFAFFILFSIVKFIAHSLIPEENARYIISEVDAHNHPIKSKLAEIVNLTWPSS